jgi:hypothetical protein
MSLKVQLTIHKQEYGTKVELWNCQSLAFFRIGRYDICTKKVEGKKEKKGSGKGGKYKM